MDGNRIARIIVPAVVLVWLANWLATEPWVPAWIVGLLEAATVCVILAALIMGFRASAWGDLARRYPVRQPYPGPWVVCATLHVSSVAAGHPDYDKHKARFISMLRLGCADDAIFLTPILPPFKVLMPAVQIPLNAITKVNVYEHSGLVNGLRPPGTLVQLTYDPNFRGQIAELTVGEPPVHLQLQAEFVEATIAKWRSVHGTTGAPGK